jgi:hypothetical protein
MIDFLTAQTLMKYDAAFRKFCSVIPELSQLIQKQDAIRAELIRQLSPPATARMQEEAVPSADMEGMESLIDEDVEDSDRATIREADTEAGIGQPDHRIVEADATEIHHEDVSSPV